MRRGLLIIISLLICGIMLVSCSKEKTVEKYSFRSGSVELNPGEDSAGKISALGEYSGYEEVDIGCGNNEIAKVYIYSGFKIQTYPDGGKDYIDKITLTNDSVSTPEGIFIGSSKDDVIKAYGNSYKEKGESLVYSKDKTTLSFAVRDGAVVSIYYDYEF